MYVCMYEWYHKFSMYLPSIITSVMYEDTMRQRSRFSKTLRCCLRQRTGPGDRLSSFGAGEVLSARVGIEPSVRVLRTFQSADDNPPIQHQSKYSVIVLLAS